MSLRLTADIRLRLTSPKFGKAELRMSARRYTDNKLTKPDDTPFEGGPRFIAREAMEKAKTNGF